MTNLGIATFDSPDDQPITVKRWVLKWLATPACGICVFVWSLNGRVVKLESARSSKELAERMDKVEKIIGQYEELRVQREHQIAELQTEVRNTKDVIDRIDTKLDRVLAGQRRR